jgi:hypothetical protein
MLPQLIQGGIQIVLGLVNGILKALPDIIRAVIKAIPQIVRALVAALPLLIQGGIQLVVGLIQGIINATPEIIKAVVEAIPMILATLKESIPQILQAGKDMITGLWNGMKEIFTSIPGKIKDIGKTIGNAAKGLIADIIPGGKSSADYKVDAHAEGGVVTRPQVGMIGENGAEAVMPLEKNTGWIGKLGKTVAGFVQANIADFSKIQKMMQPTPAMAMAGASYNIVNNFNSTNTFQTTDREMAQKVAKVNDKSAGDAAVKLARAVRTQR